LGTLRTGGDIAELRESLPPYLGIVRGLGQVTGEHHEIRFLLQRVDRRNRARERAFRFGIDFRIVVTEMNVGKLHEVEVFLLAPVVAHPGSPDAKTAPPMPASFKNSRLSIVVAIAVSSLSGGK
jgi:hypothetical protein